MPAPSTLRLAVTTVMTPDAALRRAMAADAAYRVPSPTGRGPPADTFHVDHRQGEAHQLRPFFFFRLFQEGPER